MGNTFDLSFLWWWGNVLYNKILNIKWRNLDLGDHHNCYAENVHNDLILIWYIRFLIFEWVPKNQAACNILDVCGMLVLRFLNVLVFTPPPWPAKWSWMWTSMLMRPPQWPPSQRLHRSYDLKGFQQTVPVCEIKGKTRTLFIALRHSTTWY